MAVFEARNIIKSFGKTDVLKGVSFEIEKGEVLCVIGSSGCGKTTLLRCVNFLETPDRGQFYLNGNLLFDASDKRAKTDEGIRQKRLHFGLVFQSFNLFPQYTALENVSLAPLLHAKERSDYKINKKIIKAFFTVLFKCPSKGEGGEMCRAWEFNQNQTCKHQYRFHEILRILNAPPHTSKFHSQYGLCLVWNCSRSSSPGFSVIR